MNNELLIPPEMFVTTQKMKWSYKHANHPKQRGEYMYYLKTSTLPSLHIYSYVYIC